MEDIIRLFVCRRRSGLGSFYPDVIGGKRFLCRNCRGWIPDPGDISTDKTGYGFVGYRYAGKNGWDLICELKRIDEWVPIVFYSSLYESERLEDAFSVGAEDFISKSCQPEELVNRLKALYKRALKQQQRNEICKLSGTYDFSYHFWCFDDRRP